MAGGFNSSFSARGSTRAPLGVGFNHLGVQPGGGFNQSFDNSDHDSWYTTNDPWYYHERSVVFFLQKKQKDLSKIINT